ncbi:MAG: NAD(+)/NADH kinase [Candidatus Giovannonibacteria bacterium]|nr:NAD(+)/NADH kinase [Candidatus Giovannonibacteria bacterium]
MKLALFFRSGNKEAVVWAGKIRRRLKKRHPKIKFAESPAERPGAVLVLGGDGTILEAARIFQKYQPVILGLNLGSTGFLASVREPKKFFPSIEKFLKGDFKKVERMMIQAKVLRKNKIVFEASALNEITIQNFLGMAELEVAMEKYPIQHIRGSGVMVSTSTGSTAYNLSAHGPIVMPSIKCMVLTEIMDHNIPTPSIVVKRGMEIDIRVDDFRKRGMLSIKNTGVDADVILSADGESIFPLEKSDLIKITESPRLAKFAELEPNYFFKSLHEKFAFR